VSDDERDLQSEAAIDATRQVTASLPVPVPADIALSGQEVSLVLVLVLVLLLPPSESDSDMVVYCGDVDGDLDDADSPISCIIDASLSLYKVNKIVELMM